VSENPPDPWRGSGDWFDRYRDLLTEWHEKRVATWRRHHKAMRAIERVYQRRVRMLCVIGVGWGCIGLGVHLGRDDYSAAAWYVASLIGGIPTGRILYLAGGRLNMLLYKVNWPKRWLWWRK